MHYCGCSACLLVPGRALAATIELTAVGKTTEDKPLVGNVIVGNVMAKSAAIGAEKASVEGVVLSPLAGTGFSLEGLATGRVPGCSVTTESVLEVSSVTGGT